MACLGMSNGAIGPGVGISLLAILVERVQNPRSTSMDFGGNRVDIRRCYDLGVVSASIAITSDQHILGIILWF